MSKKLWQPSLIVKKNSNLFAFENYISNKLKIKFNRNYKKLLNWSIKNSPEFWSRFWDFSKIKGIKRQTASTEVNKKLNPVEKNTARQTIK